MDMSKSIDIEKERLNELFTLQKCKIARLFSCHFGKNNIIIIMSKLTTTLQKERHVKLK
jgi:hypothetical protein